MTSFYGLILRNWVYPAREGIRGTRITNELKSLEATQHWSPDRLRDLQWSKIKRLLTHAYENTKFYKDRLNEIGACPGDIRDFSDYRKIPALTKKDIKDSLTELRARNLTEAQVIESTTGGTTADYTTFYLDKRALDFKLAATIRHDRWCGWDIGEKEAIVWPASIDFAGKNTWKSRLINVLIDRKLRLYAGVLNDEILGVMARRLESYRPVLVRGFPNPLTILAEYLKRNAQYQIRPKAIKSVGEPLSERSRTTIEEGFGCRVFNCYLSRESGTIASQCERLHHMHINAESLYVEFEQNGGPVAFGSPGEALVTDLNNFGLPFIRYRIGDMGIPLSGQCDCGRGLPLMDITAGRESDFFISPADGSYVMGLSLLVPFVERPEVGQIQVIQDRLNHLRIKIAKKSAFAPSEMKSLEDALKNIFRNKMTWTYEFVDCIPHDRSGKYRFAIREKSVTGQRKD